MKLKLLKRDNIRIRFKGILKIIILNKNKKHCCIKLKLNKKLLNISVLKHLKRRKRRLLRNGQRKRIARLKKSSARNWKKLRGSNEKKQKLENVCRNKIRQKKLRGSNEKKQKLENVCRNKIKQKKLRRRKRLLKSQNKRKTQRKKRFKNPNRSINRKKLLGFTIQPKDLFHTKFDMQGPSKNKVYTDYHLLSR